MRAGPSERSTTLPADVKRPAVSRIFDEPSYQAAQAVVDRQYARRADVERRQRENEASFAEHQAGSRRHAAALAMLNGDGNGDGWKPGRRREAFTATAADLADELETTEHALQMALAARAEVRNNLAIQQSESLRPTISNLARAAFVAMEGAVRMLEELEGLREAVVDGGGGTGFVGLPIFLNRGHLDSFRKEAERLYNIKLES